MIGGRHSDASIRAARKKVNTLWLDFQQVCSTGFCMVACVCVLTVISMYFAYTIYYLSDHYGTHRNAERSDRMAREMGLYGSKCGSDGEDALEMVIVEEQGVSVVRRKAGAEK